MKIDKIISGKLDNNTYILTKGDDCIIIDASCKLDLILEKTSGKNVLGVFLTHGHYDHFEHLDEIIKHFNVKCFLSGADKAKLFNPKYNYSVIFGRLFSCSLGDECFVELKNNQDVNLGNFNVKCLLTKGHTDGSMCFFVNNQALFTGDTLFDDSFGRTDLLTGNEEDMKKSLKFLKTMFKNVPIYPGHGDEGAI